MKKSLFSFGLVIVAMLWMLAPVSAQPADGAPREGRRGDRGQRGERGERVVERGERDARADRERMRQRRVDRLEQVLGVTDEEWQVLQPMLEKVQELSLQARGGQAIQAVAARMRGDEEAVELPAAAQAGRVLRALLAGEAATTEQIAEQLEALRTARQKNAMELEMAREQLREVLSPRQEAQLVLMGLLE